MIGNGFLSGNRFLVKQKRIPAINTKPFCHDYGPGGDYNLRPGG
jgi:hypothetical protein